MGKRKKVVLISMAAIFLVSAAVLMLLFAKHGPKFTSPDKLSEKDATAAPEKKSTGSAAVKTKSKGGVDRSSSQRSEEVNQTDSPADSGGLYPDNILDLLGLDIESVIEYSQNYLDSNIHLEWMGRLDSLISNLDPEKKDEIVQNHTILLAIKEELNQAYLNGEIDHQTFKLALAELLKWHQNSYESILSAEQYEALFEFRPDESEKIIDDMIMVAPEYSFILNQQVPIEEIVEQVQDFKLEAVNDEFLKMILLRDDLGRLIESGKVTENEARQALLQGQQEFIARCKEILTLEEINLIFGSLEALEGGTTSTEPPAYQDSRDLAQLGFRIENPRTTVEMVTEKLSREKIASLHHLYEESVAETDAFIKKLDSGEVPPEQLETAFQQIDSAYAESARKILSAEEYELVFGNQGN